MSDRVLHPLWELTLARLREFVREPAALFWTFGFPVILAVGLGIAFRSRPPDTYHVAIVINEPAAETVATNLEKAEGIALQRENLTDAQEMLRVGKLDIVVVASGSASNPSLEYHFDPTRTEASVARYAVDDAIQRGLGRADVVKPEDRRISEPGARYIDFLVPGLIGLNVMGSSMWGIGYAVALARKRRLLRRLAATPMRRAHFLLSFMLSRTVFLATEVAVLVFFGWLVFDVPLRGSLFALALLALLGAMTFTGLALLVASRTDSTEVASGWMNAVMLPMWLLSGAFFSYERFPEVIHPVIRLLPLTALNDGLRAIMSEGQPLWALGPQLLVLAAIGLAAFTAALRLFRWQ